MAKKEEPPKTEPAPDWEDVGADVYRLQVPGGWLYVVGESDKTTFVPLPPEESMLRMLQDGTFAQAMGNSFREILMRAAGEGAACRKCGELSPDVEGMKNCWKCGEPLEEKEG